LNWILIYFACFAPRRVSLARDPELVEGRLERPTCHDVAFAKAEGSGREMKLLEVWNGRYMLINKHFLFILILKGDD